MKLTHGSTLDDQELLHQIVLQVCLHYLQYFLLSLNSALSGVESKRHWSQAGDTEAFQEEFCSLLNTSNSWIINQPCEQTVREEVEWPEQAPGESGRWPGDGCDGAQADGDGRQIHRGQCRDWGHLQSLWFSSQAEGKHGMALIFLASPNPDFGILT